MSRSSHGPLPTGTITFLFSDVEGSTRLLARRPDDFAALLARHAEVVRTAVAGHAGTEVGTEGDSFFAAFPSAVDAVRAAAAIQVGLARVAWPEDGVVRVRIGLHTGDGRLGGDDYVGLDVHRAARISSAGHGGQVLISETTRALAVHDLPAGVSLRDLGEHRLKDLPGVERIWQLDIQGLPADFPAIRSLDARPNNLPSLPTALVGREELAAKAIELLKERRLLTLTGPGGTGKTRLALALAERSLPAFEDGVFFVPLEDAFERAAVASAIAAALGIRENAGRDPETSVVDHLRDRELLLVLDNFEQVVSAAPLLTESLAAAPRLHIIVTSRAVLHVSGEQEFEVPPLRVPHREDLPAPESLPQYEAVALFIDRARAVKPDFEVTNENAPAVAEICERLDGLPLAIELAAARVRLLSPQAILERLDHSLPVLARGGPDSPARQRTLEGAIDWSYRILDDPARRLFERLGVFAGGWTIELSEEVCDPDHELGIDVFEGLADLADRSLITTLEVDGGEDRFRMLHVIREFALQRLEAAGDTDDLRRRHARSMLALAERAEPELERADARRWQHRLGREEENLRSALRWTLEQDEAEMGLRIAGALWRFWHYWGRLREGVRWLEDLLDHPAARADDARVKGLTGLAGLVYWLGDAERADRLYQDALSIQEQTGDERGAAQTLLSMAYTAVGRNEASIAVERANEAMARYRAIGAEDDVVVVSGWLRTGAYLAGAGGDADDALDAARELIALFSRQGRALEEADAVGTLASIHFLAGDYAAARDAFRETARAYGEMGNVGMLPFARFGATIELMLGHPERAAVLAAVAARAVQDLGGMLPEPLVGAPDPAEDARTALGDEAYAAATERGRRMSNEEALDYLVEG